MMTTTATLDQPRATDGISRIVDGREWLAGWIDADGVVWGDEPSVPATPCWVDAISGDYVGPRNEETTTMATRTFRGSETNQICGVTGEPAQQAAWYWEPADYEGDVLWSTPYGTREEAEAAAAAAPVEA